jgi:hypothetical protein
MEHIGKIYKCICAGECSALEWVDANYDLNPAYKEIEICIWKKYPNKKNFLDRIRLAFEIIKNGTLYTDQIILDKGTVKILINDLTKWIK